MPVTIPIKNQNIQQCKRMLFRGMKGDDVKWLQETLNHLNESYKFCSSETPLTVTGFFGADTTLFLMFFQYQQNLIANCRLDQPTLDRIAKMLKDSKDRRDTCDSKFKSLAKVSFLFGAFR